MKVVHIRSDKISKVVKPTRRDEIEAIKLSIITKHNSKFNTNRNGTY